MRTIFYEEKGIVSAYYENVSNIVVVNWKTLSKPDVVRDCTLAQLETVKAGKAKAIIIDTSNAQGTPSPELQQWFGAYLFPELEKAGLKTVITVLPSNALTRLGAKTWAKTGQQFGMDFIDAATLNDAFIAATNY